MRFAVFGGTGSTGRSLVGQALDQVVRQSDRAWTIVRPPFLVGAIAFSQAFE